MKRNIKTIAMLLCLALALLAFSGCGSGSSDEKTDTGQKAETDTEQADETATEQEAGTDTGQKDETAKAEVDMNKISINTQSSIKIEGSKIIYIDPFKRSEKTHDADIIFITHEHHDHFDSKSLKRAAGKDTAIVCLRSMLEAVGALGISENVTGMEPGDTQEIGGVKVEAVPAYNLDKSFHPKENGWVGYIITLDGIRYYAAGDTDALEELAGIECDVAMVPIGGTYTMTAEEAAGLINKMKPEYVVPTHYGSIVGSPEDADTFEANIDEGIKVIRKL